MQSVVYPQQIYAAAEAGATDVSEIINNRSWVHRAPVLFCDETEQFNIKTALRTAAADVLEMDHNSTAQQRLLAMIKKNQPTD